MSVRQLIGSLETKEIPFTINHKHGSISIETGDGVDIVLSEESDHIKVTFESDNIVETQKVRNIEDYLTNNFLCSKCRSELTLRNGRKSVVASCPNGCTNNMKVI